MAETWNQWWDRLRKNPERPRTNLAIDLLWDLAFSAVLRIGLPVGFAAIAGLDSLLSALPILSRGAGHVDYHPETIRAVASGLSLAFFLSTAGYTLLKLLIVQTKSIVKLWRE